MYKAGRDCWGRIREAYAHWDTPRYNLLSLVDAGVAVKECPAWMMVKTKSLPSTLDSALSVHRRFLSLPWGGAMGRLSPLQELSAIPMEIARWMLP